MMGMISCRTYRERIHTVSFSPEPTAQQFFQQAESVCNPKKLMAIATNLDAEERDALSVLENVPFFELDNAECIAEFILSDYFR